MELTPTLLKQLKETDPTRHAAIEALMQIGDPAVPALCDVLGDGSSAVRGAAVEALGEIGSAAAIQPLLAALADPEPEVRRCCAWALSQFGKQALQAMRIMPGLLQALESPSPDMRIAAIWAIGAIRHPDTPNTLLWALGDADAAVREAAADALGKLGKDTLGTLIEALSHEHPGVRSAVARAVAQIARQSGRAGAATPALIERLLDPDPNVRRIAAQALGQIKDAQAAPGLIERLWDEYPDVRRAAAWALGEIEDSQAASSLLQALGDSEVSVQEAAAEALGKLDNAAALAEQGVITALLDVLAQGWEPVRRAAVRSLGSLGARIGQRFPDAAEAILVSVTAALSDPDVDVRRQAARALGEISRKREYASADVLSGLIGALHDPDEETRRSAAAALGTLADEQAVEGLVAVLRGLR